MRVDWKKQNGKHRTYSIRKTAVANCVGSLTCSIGLCKTFEPCLVRSGCIERCMASSRLHACCWLPAGVMSGTATGQQVTDSGNVSVKADGTGTDMMTSMKTGVHVCAAKQ